MKMNAQLVADCQIDGLTRRQSVDKAINEGNAETLLALVEGYPCACKGAVDGETDCYCRMNAKQVRAAVSEFGLRHGKVVRLR